MHARPALLAALTGLVLATSAGAAVDLGSSVGFRFLPQKTFQGQPASLTVTVRPSGVRCVPTIRYADGASQTLKAAVARSNRASWTFTVPPKARIGAASASVKCGRAGRISRTFAVVGPPAAPAKVVIKKSGFSQRVRFTTREVSYGVILSNPSPEKDALDVSVIINFIDATNRVVATQAETVGGVGAGSDFYLGGSTQIPDATPVSTLEIVTRIGSQDMAAKLGPPTSDVLVQASAYDPGWVGAVVGQVQNDHPTKLLTSSQVSAVVFDASGNVIGGGKGYSTGGLLPGVRAYFSASSGVSAIPVDRAAAAGVSVLGQYQPTS
ncbi:MAG: hypothetical protein QOF45_903 [Gaiellaceae bacterium]|nr:hypothetical protein [Gaiellaceae bacterium]